MTLKDIMTAFPGISMPEAVSRMNAHNAAAARSATAGGMMAGAGGNVSMHMMMQTQPAAAAALYGQQQAYPMAGAVPMGAAPLQALAPPRVVPNGPTPVITNISNNNLSTSIIGEGGPASKPHREM